MRRNFYAARCCRFVDTYVARFARSMFAQIKHFDALHAMPGVFHRSRCLITISRNIYARFIIVTCRRAHITLRAPRFIAVI